MDARMLGRIDRHGGYVVIAVMGRPATICCKSF
jgi:hypothetical protein